MKSLKYLTAIACSVVFLGLSAQDELSLNEAIKLGLENNKAIQIQAMETTIAMENAYRGNAGLSPTVRILGSAEYNNSNTEAEIRTFQPEPPIINIDEDGAQQETLAAVVQADYLLLGGFAGKYRFELLQNQSRIAQLEQEALINQTVVSITELFVQIARLQSREELLLENIDITTERLEKVEDRKSFGQATGLDVLRAQTDLNKETTALDDIRLAKDNLTKQLNVVIGLLPKQVYRVNVEYVITESLEEDAVLENVRAQNPKLQLAKQGIAVAESQIGLANSAYLPKLNLFANYGYFGQQNDVQQLAEINNLGYTVGASLSMNIFNGNKNKKDVQIAKLSKESQELSLLNAEEFILTEALQELGSLATLELQLERETANLASFEETFSRTEDRFFNGQASSLDLSDTQAALLSAKISVNDIKLQMVERMVRLNSLQGSVVPLN